MGKERVSKLPRTRKIDYQVPNKVYLEFAKTLEGQIMLELKRSISDKHYIESVLLSWSTVEQLLVPKLLTYVATSLKVILPGDLDKLNAQTLNLVYYSFSHDKELYDRLEIGRKHRNDIVHKLYKQKTIDNIKGDCKKATRYILAEIHKPIMDRFNGKVPIPSVNLYKNGWNDALDEVINDIKGMN